MSNGIDFPGYPTKRVAQQLAVNRFDATKGTWREADIADSDTRLAALHCVTFNTWFQGEEPDLRYSGLLETLQHSQADVIMLQETTIRLLDALTSADWVRSSYSFTRAPFRADAIPSHGVMLLSRLPIRNSVLHPISSRLSPRPRARRTALISDIHGNHAGLLAALADIENQNCDRILCLGDLVDGGPDNEQVIETLRRLNVPCMRGNHDETNDVQLEYASHQFLQCLPECLTEDDVLYMHISPRNPRNRKRKVSHAVEAWNVFDECEFRLLFIGHVHVPIIFGMRSETFGEAAIHEFEYHKPYTLSNDERYIVSIGAIGYGRDDVGKVRYAIYDAQANTVEFRAVDGPLLPLDYTLGGTTLEFL